MPVPRRLRPARLRLRTPPRHPPRRRRPHQPHQPQKLLLVAPPRRPARTRLDPDRTPRRHQPGHQPRRHDHPQPQPPTPPRVTTPALRRTPLPRRSRGAVASVSCRRRPGPGIAVARASTIVGGGNPFFPDEVRVDLELLDERRFGNGVVYMRLRRQGPRAASVVAA
jgi:hypothetical protein